MNGVIGAGFWAAATLGIYAAARARHRRAPAWWTSPMLVTWTACGALIVVFGSTYADYLRGTGWMVTLLGPATVAFAIPIHRHRALIRRHGAVLAAGVAAGCLLAVGVSWAMAAWLDLGPELRASLLPRSVTTPLAMTAASQLGGQPELTATFTAITGLFGAAVGELLLSCLPVRTAFARGALFGMGAHGAGTAKARELGEEEGAIAGLIMALAGVATVLGSTCFVWLRG